MIVIQNRRRYADDVGQLLLCVCRRCFIKARHGSAASSRVLSPPPSLPPSLLEEKRRVEGGRPVATTVATIAVPSDVGTVNPRR